jgi:hypothetical protein
MAHTEKPEHAVLLEELREAYAIAQLSDAEQRVEAAKVLLLGDLSQQADELRRTLVDARSELFRLVRLAKIAASIAVLSGAMNKSEASRLFGIDRVTLDAEMRMLNAGGVRTPAERAALVARRQLGRDVAAEASADLAEIARGTLGQGG